MDVIAHEVRASKTATPVLVKASEPVPGLRVYEQPDELRKPTDMHHWRIGHHCGLAIAAAMYEDDAIRGAHKIADLADWTKSADELLAEVSPNELYTALSWASCDHPAYA